jgi:hypothetical protein
MVDLSNITESDLRVTLSDIKDGAFDTSLSDDELLRQAWVAHKQVDDQLTGEGMDSDRLQLIELYLTRHLVKFSSSQDERQRQSVSLGSASVSYSGAFSKEGLSATNYGQTAKQLDLSGKLYRDNWDEFNAVGP